MNALSTTTSTKHASVSNTTATTAHETLVARVDSQIDSLLSGMRLVIAAAGGSSTTTTANAAANATPSSSSVTDQHTFLAAQESLVAEAATANMARSVEQLLGLTTELKQTLILNDFAALNQQILSRHRTLTNQTALCQTNLAEMRSDLIKVHQQLVDSLYGSV